MVRPRRPISESFLTQLLVAVAPLVERRPASAVEVARRRQLKDVLKVAAVQLAARLFSEFALAIENHTSRNHFSRSCDHRAIPLLSLGMVDRSPLWLLWRPTKFPCAQLAWVSLSTFPVASFR